MLTGVAARIPVVLELKFPEYGSLDMEGVLASDHFDA